MPYEVRVLEHCAVIEAAFSGRVTIAERIDAMHAIARCSERSGATRLLANFRQACPEPASREETTSYAAQLASEPTLRRMSIAYVGSPEQTDSVEMLAAVRGYFYQRFTTEEAALRWLRWERPE